MKYLANRLSPTAESFLLITLVSLAIIVGHEGKRGWQVWALAMPAFLWLWWPVRNDRIRKTRSLVVSMWASIFIFDAAARGYLRTMYGAVPDSSTVMAAIANTQRGEAQEYLLMYMASIRDWGILAVTGAIVAMWLCFKRVTPLRIPRAMGYGRPIVASLAGLAILASSVGYISKPWRRWHPIAYWPNWAVQVATLRQQWASQDDARQRAMEAAQRISAFRQAEQPETVVLVVGDSVNRDNMQLYGYTRPTTPALIERKHALGSGLTVLQDAWSTEAGTMAALKELFEVDGAAGSAPLHALAIARSAGYKIWWISNHDDLAIKQIHARFANELRMVNQVPGRSTASLDDRVLPFLQEALADPSRHKLIVVHLLGAHPHYRMRVPDDMPAIQMGDDAVDRLMLAQDRPWWLRKMRAEYDTAIRFHDQVVSKTLDATVANSIDGRRGAWMYVSDHGQEVGHQIDRAGHSMKTAAGYKIPAMIWESPDDTPPPANAEFRPFRSDWASWTLLGLMHVRWNGYAPFRDVLDAGYQWHPPDIPRE